MRTHAKRRHLRHAHIHAMVARAIWRQVESAVDDLGDPLLLEHAAIAGLAIVHLVERVEELRHDTNGGDEAAPVAVG